MTNTSVKNGNRFVVFARIFIGAWAAFALGLLGMSAPASAQQYTTPSGPLSVDATNIGPGDVVGVSGSGFAPGSNVQIVLVSAESGQAAGFSGLRAAQAAETMLAETAADAAGSFSVSVTIPADFAGSGSLEARGTSADGAVHKLTISIVGGALSVLPATGAGASTQLGTWIAGLVLAAGILLVFAGRRVTHYRAE